MDFTKDIKERVLLLDGAMSSNLIKMGVVIESVPDILNIENPEPVKRITKGYVEAGSDIIRTNTFNTMRFRLRHFGFENRLAEIAKAGVMLCRDIIKDKKYLAVSIGPSGELMPPFGSTTFDEIYENYYEIAKIYESEGVDIFWLETFTDLYELKTAIIAIRDVTKRPIVALMTFDKNMRSPFGSTPQIMASVISKLDVDAIGANCSVGSNVVLNIIAEMSLYTNKPLVAQPNAGVPITRGGITFYPESPDDMASSTEDFIRNGVRIIGACCGSTAEHISKIGDRLKRFQNISFSKSNYSPSLVLTSRSRLVQITNNSMPVIIGERINPTNKKHLTEALKSRNYTEIIKEASSQLDAGADLLDVNVGITSIDEVDILPETVKYIQNQLDVPVSVDTADDIALEKSLKNIAGRGLINSIKLDSSLEKRLSLARRHGASFIVLTMDEKGIPETDKERIQIAEKILEKASEYGFDYNDILFDFLTLSAATSQKQLQYTINAIKEFSQKGFLTVLGISNISYGLPHRSYINSTFLSFALSAGLRAAIVDPLDKNLLKIFYAASSLLGYDRNFSRYINFFEKDLERASLDSREEINPLLRLSNAIISGRKEDINGIVVELLKKKVDPQKIINDGILSAMREVGNRFKSNQMYLPQVMLSAESAQAAFDIIIRSEGKRDIKPKAKIVIATVEGDIHDLGKNLVSAVLKNSGFEVIDLGKNVKAEVILSKAIENEADIIGLSALMTTTMGKMKEVIELLKKYKKDIPVIIGGAVVTNSFANEIGAYYGKDAIDAVIVAEKIINNNL